MRRWVHSHSLTHVHLHVQMGLLTCSFIYYYGDTFHVLQWRCCITALSKTIYKNWVICLGIQNSVNILCINQNDIFPWKPIKGNESWILLFIMSELCSKSTRIFFKKCSTNKSSFRALNVVVEENRCDQCNVNLISQFFFSKNWQCSMMLCIVPD
jgi:hypothetical protein